VPGRFWLNPKGCGLFEIFPRCSSVAARSGDAPSSRLEKSQKYSQQMRRFSCYRLLENYRHLPQLRGTGQRLMDPRLRLHRAQEWARCLGCQRARLPGKPLCAQTQNLITRPNAYRGRAKITLRRPPRTGWPPEHLRSHFDCWCFVGGAVDSL
jgi:hypothetical protein